MLARPRFRAAILRLGGLAIGVGLLAAAITPAAAGTSPAPTDDPEPEHSGVRVEAASAGETAGAASARVAQMSTRERAASVVMGHVPTTDAGALRAYMQTAGIGGFILMGANIPGSEAELRGVTTALTIDPALPPLIAIDQEGGDVSRLPWDEFPSSLELKSAPPETAAAAFAGRGALVDRAGIGMNFGVVADFTDDPGSFIYRRSLGTNAADSSARVGAAVTGEAPFAASTLKHFPGHGAAPGDSHAGIPSTGMPLEQWQASEALPFAAGIDAGAPALMFGHLAYTAVDAAPATLSPEWHRIAREDLGFTGLAVTDDLGMLQSSGIPAYQDPVANAVTAIAAGNDMVLAVVLSTPDTAPRMVEGIVAAIENGALPAQRLQEAATRVTELRLNVGAESGRFVPCPACAPAQ
ncbi:glycoside hydrolase family 3 N-terminal domain-containing protein [Microbacterium sp. DT81.1]|uniref:glycoside hydrolase family 3 N-terminal domain-containing protein n=1 Tax=Microbacterium sp. DT81.1 TaxID=3393413 RepID=UPI003CF55710